jgi:hypothetical protein
MERRGNKKGNEYYEAALPAIAPDRRSKPQDQDSPLVKEKYIKEKYQLKLFTPDNLDELLALPSPSQSASSDDSPPVISQDIFHILNKSKEHSEEEMTDLEKLLQDRFDDYQIALKEQKERKKREFWNREQIALVREQTSELTKLNAMKNILDRHRSQGNEKNERLSEERRKREMEERNEKIEKRKERLIESEKRRWEAVQRAAQREQEKKILLGRDVAENPYSRRGIGGGKEGI